MRPVTFWIAVCASSDVRNYPEARFSGRGGRRQIACLTSPLYPLTNEVPGIWGTCYVTHRATVARVGGV
ncbi:hypothetical protein chiPu_0012556 [Chiloscyllium punctatum]|uniref:Uncharacterized protein n=1 Tax=Chiloscyllium punctatum TaxID=137246 RepID=A0A401SUP5_CHIPU|nr:hypothetical protein [Chiloscyllium punctatum]